MSKWKDNIACKILNWHFCLSFIHFCTVLGQKAIHFLAKKDWKKKFWLSGHFKLEICALNNIVFFLALYLLLLHICLCVYIVHCTCIYSQVFVFFPVILAWTHRNHCFRIKTKEKITAKSLTKHTLTKTKCRWYAGTYDGKLLWDPEQ